MIILALGQSQKLHTIDLQGSWYTYGGNAVSQQIIMLSLVPLVNKPNCNNAVIQNGTKKDIEFDYSNTFPVYWKYQNRASFVLRKGTLAA